MATNSKTNKKRKRVNLCFLCYVRLSWFCSIIFTLKRLWIWNFSTAKFCSGPKFGTMTGIHDLYVLASIQLRKKLSLFKLIPVNNLLKSLYLFFLSTIVDKTLSCLKLSVRIFPKKKTMHAIDTNFHTHTYTLNKFLLRFLSAFLTPPQDLFRIHSQVHNLTP